MLRRFNDCVLTRLNQFLAFYEDTNGDVLTGLNVRHLAVVNRNQLEGSDIVCLFGLLSNLEETPACPAAFNNSVFVINVFLAPIRMSASRV